MAPADSPEALPRDRGSISGAVTGKNYNRLAVSAGLSREIRKTEHEARKLKEATSLPNDSGGGRRLKNLDHDRIIRMRF